MVVQRTLTPFIQVHLLYAPPNVGMVELADTTVSKTVGAIREGSIHVTPPISAFAEIFFVVCLTYVWRSSWKVVSGRLACLSNRFRLLYASVRQRLAHGIAFADAPRLFERIVHPLSIGGRDRRDQFVTKA